MTSLATLDDYEWLIGPEAGRFLTMAAASTLPLVTLSGKLRKELSAQRTHLVLEQTDLRHRAQEKFDDHRRMFFTRVGLEQATDLQVAAHKARRFPHGSYVADLCCGIGGDLLALGARGAAIGVDLDRIKLLFASANRSAHSSATNKSPHLASSNAAPPVEFVCADVAHIPVAAFDAWHIDPDRRVGRRTTQIEMSEPGLDVLNKLLAENSTAAVKLAPAAETPPSWSSDAELEWISRAGSCRQQVAWFGDLAHSPGKRRATILRGPAESPRTLIGLPQDETAGAREIGRYLFDADPAVLAAGLIGTLATELQLAPIAPGHVYLTADSPRSDPAVACFEVQETLPLDLRRVRRLLKDRDIGRLEIKKRGVPHHPEQLRKQLRPRGKNEATLFVTRLVDRVIAILTRRLTPEECRKAL